jgi:hypothetical protein
MTEDPIAPLRDKFIVEEVPDDPTFGNLYGAWHIYCEQCKSAWVLNKPKPGGGVAIGSLLKLLNHAVAHELEKGGKS